MSTATDTLVEEVRAALGRLPGVREVRLIGSRAIATSHISGLLRRNGYEL